MEDTLSGLNLSAVWHVEKEQRHEHELAPIPRHRTVERTAVNWDQLKTQFHASKKNVVSIFVTFFVGPYLFYEIVYEKDQNCDRFRNINFMYRLKLPSKTAKALATVQSNRKKEHYTPIYLTTLLNDVWYCYTGVNTIIPPKELRRKMWT